MKKNPFNLYMKSLLLLTLILISSCSSRNYYKHADYAHACASEKEDGKIVSKRCIPLDEDTSYLRVHRLWPSQKRMTEPMPDPDDY